MGQKTNPIIFRLGKTKNWKFRYLENKIAESGLYTFTNIEIETFVKTFFKQNGLLISESTVYQTVDSLSIFISYYSTTRATDLVKDTNSLQRIKLKPVSETVDYREKLRHKQKYYYTRRKAGQSFFYNRLIYKKRLETFAGQQLKEKMRRTLLQEEQTLKIRRLKLLYFYKAALYASKYSSIKRLQNNLFFEKFVRVLHSFIGKRKSVRLTLKQVNHNIEEQVNKNNEKVLKKSLVQLRKYKQNDFFKNGVNIIFNYVSNTPKSLLLGEFIAEELTKLKRHNFFLRFVTTALGLLTKTCFSKIKAIKIRVKGRLNGTARARHKIIVIGAGVPVLTMHSNTDYAESTAFTSNGTLGIQVWTLRI